MLRPRRRVENPEFLGSSRLGDPLGSDTLGVALEVSVAAITPWSIVKLAEECLAPSFIIQPW
jgi:hypothetical protein